MSGRSRQRGATLLEVVIVVAISALIVGGVAAQFRTLRQVTTRVEQRRETLQRVRVAFERMGRLIRPTDPQGSISILDFSDQTHVFQLINQSLYYGSSVPADQLLAEGFQELCFEGYDANGPVSPSTPWDIDGVRVEATAAVPGTGETVSPPPGRRGPGSQRHLLRDPVPDHPGRRPREGLARPLRARPALSSPERPLRGSLLRIQPEQVCRPDLLYPRRLSHALSRG